MNRFVYSKNLTIIVHRNPKIEQTVYRPYILIKLEKNEGSNVNRDISQPRTFTVDTITLYVRVFS